MDPERNLELAKFLAGPPRGAPDEASYRGACGRAYYAAFSTVRDLLLAARLNVASDGSAHGSMVRLLKESSDVQVKAAGGSLDALRKERNHADYDVGSRSHAGGRFEVNRSRLAIASAQIIIETVRQAARTDPRLGIPPGITG